MARTTIAVLLLLAALLVACDGSTQQAAPTVRPSSPSPAEREYFAKFHTTPTRASVAHGLAAVQLTKKLRSVAVAQSAEVVSLRIYDLSARARLTPVVTIAVSQPARFLRDSLVKMNGALNPRPHYLRVVDGDGRRILELWTSGPGRGGYSVVRKYAGCSNLTEEGLGMPPPCPSH
jgi:hypothetical protein